MSECPVCGNLNRERCGKPRYCPYPQMQVREAMRRADPDTPGSLIREMNEINPELARIIKDAAWR